MIYVGVSVPKPEGAFYALCDISGTGMTDVEFATRALQEAEVQLIPGSLMQGGEGLVRISYATSMENIHEGVRRQMNGYQIFKHHLINLFDFKSLWPKGMRLVSCY